MPAVCHCCGAPLPDLPVDHLAAQVSPIMAAVIRAVARRPGIGSARLADIVYADDPNGGPDFAVISVRTAICRENKKLAKSGWAVKADIGASRGYRLVEVERVE